MATHSTIGRGSVVTGRVTGRGSLGIEGRVEGTVIVAGAVVISAGARVDGSIEADSLRVEGVLAGDARTTGVITLTNSALVIADLSAARIAIEDGAAFRGRVDLSEEQPGAPSPPPSPASSAASSSPERRVAPRPAGGSTEGPSLADGDTAPEQPLADEATGGAAPPSPDDGRTPAEALDSNAPDHRADGDGIEGDGSDGSVQAAGEDEEDEGGDEDHEDGSSTGAKESEGGPTSRSRRRGRRKR